MSRPPCARTPRAAGAGQLAFTLVPVTPDPKPARTGSTGDHLSIMRKATMSAAKRIVIGLCATPAVVVLVAAAVAAQTPQTPQTTTQETKGTATVTTEKMSGEVLYVEGNNLVVKMASGEIRTFSNVPDSRRATVDGKEVGVRDLQPGTWLTATVTKTTTPITVRTTTVGTGKVFFVNGPYVILTLPNGENKEYHVKPDYKFTVSGKPATVYELRKGMTVSAEKIVETPSVEFASDTKVVGTMAKKGGAPAGAQARTPAAAPAQAAAPAEAPAPTTGAAPAKLPKTGSPLPLVGLAGLLFVGGSGLVRMLRRF
jgi:LPXTG-motif cell wall-anchored protein